MCALHCANVSHTLPRFQLVHLWGGVASGTHGGQMCLRHVKEQWERHGEALDGRLGSERAHVADEGDGHSAQESRLRPHDIERLTALDACTREEVGLGHVRGVRWA
jgi:hypothetical protein